MNFFKFFLLLMVSFIPQVLVAGTPFTYQGSLYDGGEPANGNYDFQFEPFSSLNGSESLASPVLLTNVEVSDGVFSVEIDFGQSFFNEVSTYISIGVRLGGGNGPITTLSPRQNIRPTPYAYNSFNADSAVPTGTVLPYDISILPDSGWIWSDGRTIGSSSSGATNRASQDTFNLYILLWHSQGNSLLAIEDRFGNPSVRGVSAEEDFFDGKRLPVPDRRGRVNVGKDDLGGLPANRVTLKGSGINGLTLGESGGVESQVITEEQMPSHSHTGLLVNLSEDDNPDPPLNRSIIGNNLTGSAGVFGSAVTGIAGGDEEINNMPPSIVTNFIIKL